MVRSPLSDKDRERGQALGRTLQQARGRRSAAEVALRVGISLDTLADPLFAPFDLLLANHPQLP